MRKIALITITALILTFATPLAGMAVYTGGDSIPGDDTRSAEEKYASPATPAAGTHLDPYADSSGTSNSSDITDYNLKFNVKQLLSTPGNDPTGKDGQKMSYFDSDSPIVAFLTKVIEFATYIIGSIALILFIAAGFMFMVSQGNQQKLDEAKDIFKYAIIGLIVVFLSYIITIFIQSIFISAG